MSYPFATSEDVANRLGREPYTDNDLNQVVAVLQAVSDTILDELGKDEEWAAALDPVPRAVKGITVEATVRVLQSPTTGVRSETEQLGAYQHSVSYADAAGGLELTASECRRLRAAVYTQTSGSARIGAVIDDTLDLGILGGRYVELANTDTAS